MIAIIIVSLFALSIALLMLEGLGNGVVKAVQKTGVAGNISDRRTLKANESRLKDFQAYQTCPKCKVKDFHLMEDMWLGKGHWRVVRRCNNCNHGWYQW